MKRPGLWESDRTQARLSGQWIGSTRSFAAAERDQPINARLCLPDDRSRLAHQLARRDRTHRPAGQLERLARLERLCSRALVDGLISFAKGTELPRTPLPEVEASLKGPQHTNAPDRQWRTQDRKRQSCGFRSFQTLIASRAIASHQRSSPEWLADC